MSDTSGNELRTLTEVMNKLQSIGYSSNFGVKNNQLLDYDSKKTYSFDQVQLDYEFRTEGITNPDDESLLFALKTNDGNMGIVVANYSPGSDTSVIEFINQVDKSDQKDPKMI